MMQADNQLFALKSYVNFVVVYLLQNDGDAPGWRKAGIEGTLFIAERKSEPKWQLIIKNNSGTNDLVDNFHMDWELDIKTNYVFYRVEDTSKRIRGIWFHDDSERQKFGEEVTDLVNSLRPEDYNKSAEAEVAGASAAADVRAQLASMGAVVHKDMPSDVLVTANAQTMRLALHTLVDDEAWLDMVVSQLKAGAGGDKAGGAPPPPKQNDGVVAGGMGARKRQG